MQHAPTQQIVRALPRVIPHIPKGESCQCSLESNQRSQALDYEQERAWFFPKPA